MPKTFRNSAAHPHGCPKNALAFPWIHIIENHTPHSANLLDQEICEDKLIQPPNVLDERYNGRPPSIPGLTDGRINKHLAGLKVAASLGNNVVSLGIVALVSGP